MQQYCNIPSTKPRGMLYSSSWELVCKFRYKNNAHHQLVFTRKQIRIDWLWPLIYEKEQRIRTTNWIGHYGCCTNSAKRVIWIVCHNDRNRKLECCMPANHIQHWVEWRWPTTFFCAWWANQAPVMMRHLPRIQEKKQKLAQLAEWSSAPDLNL